MVGSTWPTLAMVRSAARYMTTDPQVRASVGLPSDNLDAGLEAYLAVRRPGRCGGSGGGGRDGDGGGGGSAAAGAGAGAGGRGRGGGGGQGGGSEAGGVGGVGECAVEVLRELLRQLCSEAAGTAAVRAAG